MEKIYDLLDKSNEQEYHKEEDFFCAINSSSKLDKFASFVIDRLSK